MTTAEAIKKAEQERDEAMTKARRDISRALKSRGPFSHNIIGSTLRDIDQKHGRNLANGLVDEFDLQRAIGIGKEPS